ncbi:histidine phosphatase family protein [Actinopolymorpha rutila]|uniref:Putative phosphoglycerate mutase n=1 Tax=Actinopolymorpha rutila TaxID=446787 RepID=A0A852ZH07_9ACTN|nr:putative phosphoglycerate mutase [Actinopolymorpha rutila]
MKNIYVVTHPEATHHIDGLVGGWFDSELTDRGIGQAEAIAMALSERLNGAAVETISSDLSRTQRTAEIIVERLGGDLVLDPDLRERSYGEAGGRPQAWLEKHRIPHPEFGDRLRHNEGVNGETWMDLAVRAYAAMKRIQASAMENQVVVTHGGTTTFLLAAWIGMPLEATGRVHFRVSSGGITHLRRDDRIYSHQITRLNETSHLN